MIGVAGAGAFGTALAGALARQGAEVALWARRPAVAPTGVRATTDIADLTTAAAILIAVPMQSLTAFLAEHAPALTGRRLIACCKGVDLATLQGPTALLAPLCPTPALLTGPSFAADIAAGLPTALTLACADDVVAEQLQVLLSTPHLRLYRTTDVIGAELGGALKNVIAIAAGVVIGAGFGDSARAALLTRGYAEMLRLALHLGARAETLAGLSGLGDLVLTCTSPQSRNFRYGLAVASQTAFDPGVTVEGVATARAVAALAARLGIDMPLTTLVAALTLDDIALPDAVHSLLSRPLKPE